MSGLCSAHRHTEPGCPRCAGDLEPRLRLMLELIVRNRAAIVGPKKGCLELHFKDAHVSGRLVAPMVTELTADDDGPLGAV